MPSKEKPNKAGKTRGAPSAPRDPAAPPVMGRPEVYTPELADHICDELMRGKSLIKICDQDGYPDRITVVRWLSRYPDFEKKYRAARESQADLMDDLIIDTAKGSNAETAPADRVKIMAYQWRAARLMPARYGDNSSRKIIGHDGGPVQLNVSSLSDADLKLMESLLAKTIEGTAITVDNPAELDNGD